MGTGLQCHQTVDVLRIPRMANEGASPVLSEGNSGRQGASVVPQCERV